MDEQLDSMKEQSLKSIGGVLLLARTEAGLSQDDIAQKLYLPQKFIQQLENDEFDQFEYSPVFIRGYIRSYARLVNVPEAHIIELLNKTGIREQEKLKKNYVVPTKQVSAGDHKMRFITYGIIILVLILTFAWWHSHVSNKHQTTKMPTPEISQTASDSTKATQDVAVAPTHAASTVKQASSNQRPNVDSAKIKSQLTMDNGKS